MGDWGFGNLEDDDALDYVDVLTNRIVAELERTATKRRLTADEVLTRCTPRLAVLALLVRGVPTTAGLTASQVVGWQTAFLAAFDRGAGDIYDDPTDARRRRRAIERVLGQLAKAAPDGES